MRAVLSVILSISFAGSVYAQFSLPAEDMSYYDLTISEIRNGSIQEGNSGLLAQAVSLEIYDPHLSSIPSPDYSFILDPEQITDFNVWDYSRRPKKDTIIFKASPGVDRKYLTFEQRNSGAFKRKKKGGMKDPYMAALCSGVVPGLGQIYNGQWWKTPVLYAGAGVLAYFFDMNLKERRVYDREIKARTDTIASAMNPDLAGYSLQEILDLRNYYEHNFELCIIIAGAVYLLNIMDAAVYAHLSSFNVSPDLSMSIKPYARTNFAVRNSFPLDAGIKVTLTLK